MKAVKQPYFLIQLPKVQRVWKKKQKKHEETEQSETSFYFSFMHFPFPRLSSLYLPSQLAKSLKVTRLSQSWSRRVKVRLASVSVCWLETSGHGTSSPYRLLN